MEEVEPVQIAITPYGLKVPNDWSCFCVFSDKTPLHRRWPATCHPSASSVPGPRDSCASLVECCWHLPLGYMLHKCNLILFLWQVHLAHTHTMHLQWLWNLILPCWNQQTIWKIGHWLTSSKLKHLPCKCSGRMKSRDLWKVAPVASWDALSESWSAFFCYLVGRWLNLQRTLLLQIRDSNHHPNGFQTPSKI